MENYSKRFLSYFRLSLFILILILFSCDDSDPWQFVDQGDSTQIEGLDVSEGQSKIVGGNEAEVGAYPWMVSIEDKYGHFCGGSLIGDEWVVSAAHCFFIYKYDLWGNSEVVGKLNPSEVTVSFWRHNLEDEGIQVPVKSIQTHKFYDHDTNDNDLALIRLDLNNPSYNPEDFSKIKLDTGGEYSSYQEFASSYSSYNLKALGWGLISPYSFDLSETLQEVDLDIMSQDQYEDLEEDKLYTDFNESIMLGAGGFGKDAAEGDSGGPLFYCEFSNSDRNCVLVGITSWGPSCYPGNDCLGVYTKVAAFKLLLEEEMQEEVFSINSISDQIILIGNYLRVSTKMAGVGEKEDLEIILTSSNPDLVYDGFLDYNIKYPSLLGEDSYLEITYPRLTQAGETIISLIALYNGEKIERSFQLKVKDPQKFIIEPVPDQSGGVNSPLEFRTLINGVEERSDLEMTFTSSNPTLVSNESVSYFMTDFRPELDNFLYITIYPKLNQSGETTINLVFLYKDKEVKMSFKVKIEQPIYSLKTIYVSKDEEGDFSSIQTAINSISENALIIVSPGIYSEEHLYIRGKQNIMLKSEQGPDKTVLKSANSKNQIIYISSSRNIELDGFMIVSSNDRYGSAISSRSSSFTIKNSLIVGEELEESSMALLYCNGTYLNMSNVVISSNKSLDKIFIFFDGCQAVIKNSIIWGNELNDDSESIFQVTEDSDLSITYSCLQEIYPGDGNINQDPFLFDPFNGNYHLSLNSPCIDAGYPNEIDPDGTRKDMGVFYYDQTPITKEITLYPGWNLISLPVIPSDNDLGSIFPGIDTAYKYEHKFDSSFEYLESDYTKVDKLEPGVGYWISSSVEKTYTLTGLSVPEVVFLKEYSKERWHLLGGLTDIFQVETDFGNKIQGVYRYIDDHYESIEDNQIEPGVGFWLWLSED